MLESLLFICIVGILAIGRVMIEVGVEAHKGPANDELELYDRINSDKL